MSYFVRLLTSIWGFAEGRNGFHLIISLKDMFKIHQGEGNMLYMFKLWCSLSLDNQKWIKLKYIQI